jgi:hypothetical protein
VVVAVTLAGCPGTAPQYENEAPDAGRADGPAAPIEESLLLTGKVKDYFTRVAVSDAIVATDGLAPPKSATSINSGDYAVQVAVGSSFFVTATKGLYRPTRNQAITVEGEPVTQDVFVTSAEDVKKLYSGVGATPTVGTAFIAAELKRTDGQPLAGVPMTSIKLLDANGVAVVGFKGPYVFYASNAIDASLTTTAVFEERSRIALLDVPAGAKKLVATYAGGVGEPAMQTIAVPLIAVEDGSTLVLVGGPVAATTGTGSGGDNSTLSFATNIYPKLQRAAIGGLGCGNCHTAEGSAGTLPFDAGAASVLANLTARVGVINTVTPASSRILLRPLYEPPPALPDHPNATFLDVNDPDYRLFLNWITNGAKP